MTAALNGLKLINSGKVVCAFESTIEAKWVFRHPNPCVPSTEQNSILRFGFVLTCISLRGVEAFLSNRNSLIFLFHFPSKRSNNHFPKHERKAFINKLRGTDTAQFSPVNSFACWCISVAHYLTTFPSLRSQLLKICTSRSEQYRSLSR